MGKGVQLLLMGISLLILSVYYIAYNSGFNMIISAFGVYFTQLFIPTTIINAVLLFYSLFITLVYALKVEGREKNIFKAMLSILYIGTTYMYTQMIGLLKWKHQGVWVKTPHKHTKKKLLRRLNRIIYQRYENKIVIKPQLY